MASRSYQWFARARGFFNVRSALLASDATSDQITDRLKAARNDGTLTLVLGAGVSYGSGVPGWQELVSRAINTALGPSFGPEATARMVTVLNDRPMAGVRFVEGMVRSKPAFRTHLLSALYQKVDDGPINDTLEALSEVILGVDGGRPIPEILTYNFDNLLETSLRRMAQKCGMAVEVQSICEAARKVFRAKDVFRICHLHGYLPLERDRSIPDFILSTPIILSETDFNAHFANKKHWSNRVQEEHFSKNTCLFLGMSFTDPNPRRFLQYVWQRRTKRGVQHAIVFRAPASSCPEEQLTFLRQDFASFGLAPIWIRDFGEIASTLRAIR